MMIVISQIGMMTTMMMTKLIDRLVQIMLAMCILCVVIILGLCMLELILTF